MTNNIRWAVLLIFLVGCSANPALEKLEKLEDRVWELENKLTYAEYRISVLEGRLDFRLGSIRNQVEEISDALALHTRGDIFPTLTDLAREQLKRIHDPELRRIALERLDKEKK